MHLVHWFKEEIDYVSVWGASLLFTYLTISALTPVHRLWTGPIFKYMIWAF